MVEVGHLNPLSLLKMISVDFFAIIRVVGWFHCKGCDGVPLCEYMFGWWFSGGVVVFVMCRCVCGGGLEYIMPMFNTGGLL